MKKDNNFKLTVKEEKELNRAQLFAWMVFFGIGVGYLLITLTLV